MILLSMLFILMVRECVIMDISIANVPLFIKPRIPHCYNGVKYYCLVFELLNHLRSKIKYEEDEKAIVFYEEMRKYIFDQMAERDINIDW